MNIFTLYFVTGQLLWGFLPIFWKSLSMLDPLYILAVRIIFAALLGGGFIYYTGRGKMLRDVLGVPALKKRLFWASFFVTMNWGLYILAVNTSHILQASLAYFMNPIMCLAASALLLKEPLGPWQKAAAAVAAAGMALSFFLYGSVPWLALAICLTFSVYSLIKKKVSAPSEITVLIEALYMVIPSLLYILWAEPTGQGALESLHGWQWLLLPATGLFTALPLMFFSAGIKGISLSSASILMYIAPSLQIAVGFFYGETLSVIMTVNFIFVIAAVLLFITGNLLHNAAMKEAILRSVRMGKHHK